MIRQFLRALFLLLLAPGGLWAEAPFEIARPALRIYGMEDGLPSGTVYCFARDSKGRLWAGSVDGAAYSTGHGWVSVRMPQESTSQYIRGILASKDGSLWFGTQDGGLWRLKDGAWSHCEGGRELPSNRINCLLETTGSDGGAVLWVGTGAGIACLEQGRWRAIGRAPIFGS